jgi:hypothetical protein
VKQAHQPVPTGVDFSYLSYTENPFCGFLMIEEFVMKKVVQRSPLRHADARRQFLIPF